MININCSKGYTNISEFTIHDTCIVNSDIDRIFKTIAAVSAIVLFILQIIYRVKRNGNIKDKKKWPQIIAHYTIFHGIFMGLRPLIEIFTNERSINNIFISLLTHLEAASAANLIILFIYYQLNTIHKGSIKKLDIVCIHNRFIILLSIDIVQLIMFIIGPFLYHYDYTVKNYANVTFWVSVSLITITTIPFFTLLGLLLYYKIKKTQMTKYFKVAKHILVLVIICGSVGLFTLAVAIYCSIDTRYEWIFIELCWISNIYLNFVIYLLVIRKQQKNIVTSSSDSNTDKSTTDKSTKININIT